MALSASSLTASGSTTDAGSFNTASISPAGNSVLLLWVVQALTGGATVTGVSGLSLTWTQQKTIAISSSTRLDCWAATTGPSPGSGAVTISLSGTVGSIVWDIDQYSDTAGTPSIAGTNIPTGGPTSSTAASVTYATAQGTGSLFGYGCGAAGFVTQTPSESPAWTELADQEQSTPSCALETQVSTDSTHLTGSSTLSSSVAWCTIGIEIAAAPAAAPRGAPAQPGRTWLRRFHHRQFPPPAGPLAPFTVVQAAPPVHLSSLTGPVSITLPQATGSGNTLVACASSECNNSINPAVTGITLGGGADNWASVVKLNSTTRQDAEIWYDPGCASGQTAVAVTFGGSNASTGDLYVSVYEVAGLLAADQTSSSEQTAATFTSGTTPAVSQLAEIFFGCVNANPGVTAITPTGVGTWTAESLIGTPSGSGHVSAYQQTTSGGTAAFSGTLNTSEPNTAVVATFSAGTGTATGAAAIAGAGAVTAVATQAVIAAPAGAGTVSTTTVQAATAVLAGAGTVTAVATQTAGTSLTGAGTVTDVATQAVTAAAAGAGTVTALATEAPTATLTGTGSVTDVVTQIVTATLTGAGSVTATGTSGGAPTASLAGAGSLTAVATVAVTATAAGAGTVTAATVQGAGAALPGTGALTAKATQAAIATAAGAGTVTAAATQAATAALTGAGSLTAAGAITGAATLAAAGTVSAKATQGATAALTGSGALTAAVTQRPAAVLAGAGGVTATGLTTALVIKATATATVTGKTTTGTVTGHAATVSVTDPRDATTTLTGRSATVSVTDPRDGSKSVS